MKHYFDIETEGLDAKIHRILTIQWQSLDEKTGKPLGELKILKQWEFPSKKELIETCLRETRLANEYRFSFQPVGYNLAFENQFLKTRAEKLDIPLPQNILDKVYLDVHHVGIMMNSGELKGSGLDKLTGKPHGGHPVPGWHKAGEYDKIIEYVKKEAEEFIRLNSWLLRELPILKEKLMGEFSVKVDSPPKYNKR